MQQEPMVDVELSLGSEVFTALEQLADDRDMPLSELVQELVEASLRRLGYIG